MTNVIEFPSNEDFKNVSYIDADGDLGVITRCRSIGVFNLNNKEFEVVHNNGSFVIDRETLGEFLQVASIFVDSEGRYKPNLDMVGCDY